MRVLVIGGAGFLGSALVRRLIATTPLEVLNVDGLGADADLSKVAEVARSPRYAFVHADPDNARLLAEILERFTPDRIFTCRTATGARLRPLQAHWHHRDPATREAFRVVALSIAHELGDPSRRATAGESLGEEIARLDIAMPVVTVEAERCLGPHPAPTALLHRTVAAALDGRTVELDPEADAARDWLHVDDLVEAALRAAEAGESGARYRLGGVMRASDREVARAACGVLDRLVPDSPHRPHAVRLAVTAVKGPAPPAAAPPPVPQRPLDWSPRIGFDEGLLRSVAWLIADGPGRRARAVAERSALTAPAVRRA